MSGTLPPSATAVVTKTRSPHTTGDELPSPGTSARQATPAPEARSKSIGMSLAVATPLRFAPRNPGQLTVGSPDSAKARISGALTRAASAGPKRSGSAPGFSTDTDSIEPARPRMRTTTPDSDSKPLSVNASRGERLPSRSSTRAPSTTSRRIPSLLPGFWYSPANRARSSAEYSGGAGFGRVSTAAKVSAISPSRSAKASLIQAFSYSYIGPASTAARARPTLPSLKAVARASPRLSAPAARMSFAARYSGSSVQSAMPRTLMPKKPSRASGSAPFSSRYSMTSSAWARAARANGVTP